VCRLNKYHKVNGKKNTFQLGYLTNSKSPFGEILLFAACKIASRRSSPSFFDCYLGSDILANARSISFEISAFDYGFQEFPVSFSISIEFDLPRFLFCILEKLLLVPPPPALGVFDAFPIPLPAAPAPCYRFKKFGLGGDD